MSQSQTVEEIMQRIRAQVKKQEHPAQPETTAPASSGQSESVAEIIERIRGKAQAGTGAAGITASDNASEQATAASQVSMKAAAPRPPFRFKLHELSQLRVETATALQGSRDTGQLNPRNPGPINALIQFIKKIMRRSLTWYTRPIHVFQAGVIRALQQVLAILDDHRDHLQRIADELNEHAEAIERNRAWTSARLESQATAQEQSLQQVAQRMDTAFASTNAALASHDSALNDLARKIPSELSERNAQQIDALKSELQGQRQEMQSLLTQMRQATAQQRTRERDMRRLVHAVEQGTLPQSSPAPQVAPMFPSQIKGDYEFDYFVFEDQYRGDEADIRGRQAAYLEYFRGRDNVVDIGCGRGEFLELLRDNGIPARGVELGTDQYLLCKEKGLDVVQTDLFAFLESLPDESLGGIFSAQVIEHMTASDQLRYVALAYQKTKPGSPVIFETINPQCVYALVRNFFLDPTHVRPIHPETLRFAMESTRFRNVEVRFSGLASDKQIPPLSLEGNPPGLQQFNSAIERLNELLYGYQDYAAIGWK